LRRLARDNKGVVRVIEAFFASMLVLGCLMLIPIQTPNTTPPVDLSIKAQNILLSLDGDGQLGSIVNNHDWAALCSSIESTLPLTMWFNLTVYDSQMNELNSYPICNGGQPSNQISSVTYVCASQNSVYSVYVLQLQLAVVD
jgi:hypothetical protein